MPKRSIDCPFQSPEAVEWFETRRSSGRAGRAVEPAGRFGRIETFARFAARRVSSAREFDLEASLETAGVGAGVRSAAAADLRGTLLKYKADRGPVAYVLAVFALRLAIWALATPLICAISVVPLVVLGMFVAPINHHHQHVNAFRFAWLNRLYELALSLQCGVGPYSWVLHHNLGHHLNYLNQRPHAKPDESRWTRADGSQMGQFEYSIDLLLHH